MKKQASNPSHRFIRIPLAIVFLGTAAILLNGCGGERHSAADLPLHTIDFNDGSRIEVLAIDIGELQFQEGAQRRGWLRLVSSSESSTYGHAFHGANFDTIIQTDNGVRSWTARQGNMRPLLIAMSLHAADGAPWKIARSYDIPFLHEDFRFEEPGNKTSSHTVTDPSPEIVGEDVATYLRSHDIDLNLQYLDPIAGWIALSGPLWIGEEFPAHHVAALPVWCRDQEKLDFRIIRDTGEIIHFDLPAPQTPAADKRVIHPESLPLVRKGDGYDVRLTSVQLSTWSGVFPTIKSDLEIVSSKYTVGNAMRENLTGYIIGIRDEAGNVSGTLWLSEAGFVHPSSTHFEILYRVRRGTSFPTPEVDCIMVAEGIVCEEGEQIVFSLLPEVEETGINEVAPAAILTSDSHWFPPDELSQKVTIRLEADFSNGMAPGFLADAETSRPRIVVFDGSETESFGLPMRSRSSFSTSHGKIGISTGSRSATMGGDQVTSLSVEINWHVADGTLTPGRRVRVAFAPPLEDDIHSFPLKTEDFMPSP